MITAFQKGILDGIVDDFKTGVNSLGTSIKNNWTSSTAMMKDAAKDALDRATSSAGNTAIREPIDDLLTDLENLSTGVMNSITYGVVDRLNALSSKVNDKIKETLTLNNAVEAIRNPSSVIEKAKNSFNMNSLISAVKSFSASPNPNLNKLWSVNFENMWDGKDPISNMGDVIKYIQAIIEDVGFITDKHRSIKFSRNGLFVTRPILESDSGGYYRSYAFLTRPNCNLVYLQDSVLNCAIELKDYPEMYSQVLTDMELYSELCRDNCGKSNLFQLLSNYIKEIPPIRLSESNREGIKNLFNKSMPMPGMPEIYTEADIPITFVDNSRGDVSKLLYALSMYKTLVGREGYPMRPEYIKYKGIDYLMSCYIVTVDPNWEIVGFGVALGLMISEPPTHFTQHRMDGFSKPELLEEFTVNFKATTYIPYAPHYYDTFNRLFGFNPGNIIDTRGSATTLYVADRENQGTDQDNGSSNRSSVFSSDSGINLSSANIENIADGININIGGAFTKNLINKGMQIASQFISQPGTGQTNTNSVSMNAITQYPDVFEMVARSPGVYTAVNANERTRTIFKLGFSW